MWWYEHDVGGWRYKSFGEDFDAAWDLYSLYIADNGMAVLDKDAVPIMATDLAKEAITSEDWFVSQ